MEEDGQGVRKGGRGPRPEERGTQGKRGGERKPHSATGMEHGRDNERTTRQAADRADHRPRSAAGRGNAEGRTGTTTEDIPLRKTIVARWDALEGVAARWLKGEGR